MCLQVKSGAYSIPHSRKLWVDIWRRCRRRVFEHRPASDLSSCDRQYANEKKCHAPKGVLGG